MSENKLNLNKRTVTGKKTAAVRAEGFIPSVIYGGAAEPILAQSAYNDTEKVLRAAGYHSTIDLDIDGKKQLVIVKNIGIDPVSRRIVNVEFQAVSANEAIEATTPIVFEGFETSDANKLHYVLLQVMEEIEVKAKPADLPEKLVVNVAHMANLDDKVVVSDIVLPKGVELADKELSKDQIVANLYDPAAEAAAREAADAAAAEKAEAAEEAPAEEAKSEGAATEE